MRIQNNVPALNAHRYYGINQTGLTKSIAKLSSGYRINSAADDAAGLAISEKMRAQIRGLTMASKNTQDAISLIQTAEGGMQEIDNMVQRIRELVVYASNDTQDQSSTTATQGDRRKIQDEIDALTAEIDSMANRVEFNKKKLISGEFMGGDATARKTFVSAAEGLNTARQALINYITDDGTDWTKNVQAAVEAAQDQGTDAAESATQNLEKVLGLFYEGVSDILRATTDIEMHNLGNETDGTGKIADAMRLMTSLIASTGFGNATTSISAAMNSAMGAWTTVPSSGYLGKAKALDVALETYMKAEAIINSQANTGLYFQVGANGAQGLEASIGAVTTNMLGIGDGYGNSLINVMETSGKKITYQLDVLDTAMTYVTSQRSKLGAIQNRLEYTQSSLDISAENLTNAESRIRDVDMAKEMTTFTKQNILFQASTAMLAQANALPQGVLQMLG